LNGTLEWNGTRLRAQNTWAIILVQAGRPREIDALVSITKLTYLCLKRTGRLAPSDLGMNIVRP